MILRANRTPLRLPLRRRPLPTAFPSAVGPHYLPFAGNSVDLVVMPHTPGIRCQSAPRKSCARSSALVPEGHVIVTGFNRPAFGGAAQACGARRCRSRRGAYPSVPAPSRTGSRCSAETAGRRLRLCYAPGGEEKWLRRFRFLDAAGDRWWLIGGASTSSRRSKRQHRHTHDPCRSGGPQLRARRWFRPCRRVDQ